MCQVCCPLQISSTPPTLFRLRADLAKEKKPRGSKKHTTNKTNTSTYFIISTCLGTCIDVKIVETLLSFRGYFKLGSNIPHPPHPPGQCCVIFCFLRPLTTAVQHWLGGRGKGFPQKYFFDYFSLKTIKVSLLVSSVNKVSQLILSPIEYIHLFHNKYLSRFHVSDQHVQNVCVTNNMLWKLTKEAKSLKWLWN